MIDVHKRKALEAAGFRSGTVAQLLGLTDAESRMVELRVAIARAIRERRSRMNLTQPQLAERIGSSQSRVAKIEAAAVGVSLDLMFRAHFALGGELAELNTPAATKPKRRRQMKTARSK